MEPSKGKKTDNKGALTFTEALRPPLWLLAFIFFLLASLALSVWAAFDNRAGLITLLLAVISLIIINQSMIMRIHVNEGELRIGRAHINRIYLAAAKELTIDEMKLTRGRNADPAAFLAIRFWQPRGVRVEVVDSRDSTPYWLISSKNAKGLVEALNRGK